MCGEALWLRPEDFGFDVAAASDVVEFTWHKPLGIDQGLLILDFGDSGMPRGCSSLNSDEMLGCELRSIFATRVRFREGPLP